jgi:hypothetical protein
MASRPNTASSHGRPAAGIRPCGVVVINMPMSAPARRIHALNSDRSICTGTAAGLRRAPVLPPRQRSRERRDLDGQIRGAAAERERDRLLATAADLQAIRQVSAEMASGSVWQSITVSRTIRRRRDSPA